VRAFHKPHIAVLIEQPRAIHECSGIVINAIPLLACLVPFKHKGRRKNAFPKFHWNAPFNRSATVSGALLKLKHL
jgi:hypothetical protein